MCNNEVSMFTDYEEQKAMQNVEIGGYLGSLKVISTVTIWQSMYNSLIKTMHLSCTIFKIHILD